MISEKRRFGSWRERRERRGHSLLWGTHSSAPALRNSELCLSALLPAWREQAGFYSVGRLAEENKMVYVSILYSDTCIPPCQHKSYGSYRDWQVENAGFLSYTSIHSSIHSSILSFTYPSMHLSIHSSIHLFIHPFIYVFIQFIDLSIHPFIHPSDHPFLIAGVTIQEE